MEFCEIATEITGADSKEQIYQRTVDGAVELFAADLARVVEAESDQLVPAASSKSVTIPEPTSISTIVGYAWQSYQSGTVLRVDDLADTRSADASSIQNDESQPQSPEVLRALLSIPLGECGVLQVFATEPAAFSDHDEEVAEMLSTFVTTALQRLAAEATIRRERDRLEEFASLLSHDLRNPLTVAQGHLEIAETANGNTDLTAIGRALDRMEQLIEDMLTLAREGDAVGETEAVSLRAIAIKAWGNVATGSASLEIESSLQLEADRSRLVQAFENFFRNAIEHGGDAVTIRVGALDTGFYIEDTGPGIPEDDRADIFESGYTTHQDGLGFGLAIVKHIVEAHGWTINVTTGTDGGARFEIRGVQSPSGPIESGPESYL